MLDPLATLAVHRPGHVAVVVVFIVAVVALCRCGRGLRRRDELAELRFRRRLGGGMLAVSLLIVGWYLLPSRFDVNWSLPLHICDLAGFIAPLALITRRKPFRVLLYFWGFGLTTQGFITPIVAEGPDHVRFYLFWLNHSIVVASAIYDVAVGRYRPTPGQLGATIVGSAVYACVIFGLDRAIGANYLFIGPSKPDATTVVDALGPYPQRVGAIVALAIVALVLAYLPWPIASAIRGRSAQPGSQRTNR